MNYRFGTVAWVGAIILAAGPVTPREARSELVKRPIYVNSEGKTVYQYVFQSTKRRYARGASYYPYYYPSYGRSYFRVRHYGYRHHVRPIKPPSPPRPVPHAGARN